MHNQNHIKNSVVVKSTQQQISNEFLTVTVYLLRTLPTDVR